MDQPTRSTASPPRPLVGSVVQAIAVLRHLGRLDRPEGVTAIAARLRLSPSSCFNILKTLAAEELATFDPQTRAYSLGPGAIDLARAALGRDEVVRAARPAMDGIAEKYDVAVGLWRLGSGERLTLTALSESESATRIHLVIGQRQPAEAGATGRAVLAARGASDAAIRNACAAVRWRQPPSPADYVAQVRAARAKGWALDADQIIIGVTTVAAVIADREGQVRFSLSASTFTGREPPRRIEQIGEAICDAAQAIARSIYGIAAAPAA
ncbi:MAG: IclR family transcriptional regulator [Sphingomonadaceae bacterium]|nr:IclR family transcriptional regulator [Sphingomonadaceae bacterium]